MGLTLNPNSLSGSLNPDLQLDHLGVNQVDGSWEALVFPCCQGRTLLVQMRSLGRCKASMERMIGADDPLGSTHVFGRTDYFCPWLKALWAVFCHCELNCPCVMQGTWIHSKPFVAWMLKRRLSAFEFTEWILFCRTLGMPSSALCV